ncbi:MAG: CotH kinase family protein [Bacteroidota bacterium]
MKNIIFILLLFWIVPAFGQLYINEACSQNKTILLDEFGESSDWLELYNAGSSAINLQGYHLSDDQNDPDRWTFPAVEIPAGGYLLVFASDRNDTALQNPHTNFKLSKEGERLQLTDPEGQMVHWLVVPQLEEDLSYGLQPDGSATLRYFSDPTPGSSNNAAASFNFSAPPIFSVKQAFHQTAFSLSLQCASGDCDIYYTTDGRPPTAADTQYTTALLIDSTLTIRARAYTPGLEASTVATKTYFYQSPHELPIMSLTTDPFGLWDWEEGIFVEGPNADTIFPYYGANYWENTELPVVMEYFKEEQLVAHFEVGLKNHGGKSARTKPMKSVRLIADESYADKEMNYPFFDNKAIQSYKRLVLRNASGDYNYTHFRDAYIHRYCIDEEIDLDVSAHQPIVVYLNGTYWGVMNLREKVDAYYLQENYGIDPNEVDLLEEYSYVVEGDFEIFDEMAEFVRTADLTQSSNYAKATAFFDVENMANYFIIQTILNNTDWPENNIKYWRERKDGARWRYLLFDLDVGMGRHGWTRAYGNSFGTRMDSHQDNHLVSILRALLANDYYRHYFINRYADLLNDSFREDRLLAETEATAAEIEEEMHRHFDKWGWPGIEVWKNDRLESLYRFIQDRPAYARQYVMDYFGLEKEVVLNLNTYPPNAGRILINTIEADALPWKGFYFKDIPVRLRIEPNPGFTFSHWQSQHLIKDPIYEEEININFTQDDQISAIFEQVSQQSKARVFPNPVTEQLVVQIEVTTFESLQYQVYDAQGKALSISGQQALYPGQQTINLTVSDLDAGFYWLRLESNEVQESLKFIKY